MPAYRITSDSTVDMTPARMEELQVPFVQLSLLLEGKQMGDDMQPESAKYLYDAMRNEKVGTTSQATVESFLSLWEPMLQAGQDILYVGFSSGLSGTVNSGQIAREQLLQTYPDRRIFIVDSLCASAGEGLFLEYAVQLKDSGMEIEALYQELENSKHNVHHWFTVDDLVYLRRGGRVSGAAALLGSLLHIKPVMRVNVEGKLVPSEKVKGRRSAIKRMFSLLEENIDLEKTNHINISQADCRDEVQQLVDLINEKYPALPVHVYSVGAVIGAHSGPGTIALFFFGGPITD